ncbi:hypothetical protein [Streptomyces griseorubiginosus]|uniref:hypothetical protein n=1 Tax=Streptomyces griseorubiginosus TaxID=67304 RepID=UPI00076BD574|nr:hypothetical protein [Streptomyces griseorubiginosus]KUM69258.1 hypothetical protein AQI84_34595 [Streptomyces griseorubiginosus]
MAAPPQQRPNRAQNGERDARIYSLRLANLTERQIAAEVGLSPTRVHEILAEQTAEHIAPVAEAYAAEREAELQDLYRKSYRLAVDPSTSDGEKLKALATCVKINESRRTLRGANAPQRTEITLSQQAELDADLVARSLLSVVGPVIDAVRDAVDPGYAERLREFTVERLARELERIDGQEPTGPEPEPPTVRLAITAGTAEAPSEGLEEGGPTSGPHPRRRDTATTILAQVDRMLEEDDDDEDDEDDQG